MDGRRGGVTEPLGTAARWSATLDPAKGWESQVHGRRLIRPAVSSPGARSSGTGLNWDASLLPADQVVEPGLRLLANPHLLLDLVERAEEEHAPRHAHVRVDAGLRLVRIVPVPVKPAEGSTGSRRLKSWLCLAKTHPRIRVTTLIACVARCKTGKSFSAPPAPTANRPCAPQLEEAWTRARGPALPHRQRA